MKMIADLELDEGTTALLRSLTPDGKAHLAAQMATYVQSRLAQNPSLGTAFLMAEWLECWVDCYKELDLKLY